MSCVCPTYDISFKRVNTFTLDINLKLENGALIDTTNSVFKFFVSENGKREDAVIEYNSSVAGALTNINSGVSIKFDANQTLLYKTSYKFYELVEYTAAGDVITRLSGKIIICV